jgi:tetratricopeptide (TPR) repeat protein
MATAEICSQCGCPFDDEALRKNSCKKCRSAILITSVAYLEKFERPAIQKYISQYSDILKRDPDDRDALLSMGICYLKLGLFDNADKFLERLVNAHPTEASGYYYKAICCLKGRRPKTAPLNTIREAEQLMTTAMTLEPGNARHDVMLAALRHDYYVVNGLRVPEPTPAELMGGIRTKHLDTHEFEQGLALLKILDSPFHQALRTTHQRL